MPSSEQECGVIADVNTDDFKKFYRANKSLHPNTAAMYCNIEEARIILQSFYSQLRESFKGW